jgi:hypothetical protein
VSHVDLGYDNDEGLCVISVDSDLVFEGFEITAFGSEYESADTQFAVWVQDERVLTRRPEPLLVSFLSDIVSDRKFVLDGESKTAKVSLDKAQQVKLAKVAREIERELPNAPLGGYNE